MSFGVFQCKLLKHWHTSVPTERVSCGRLLTLKSPPPLLPPPPSLNLMHQRLCIFGLYGAIQILLLLLLSIYFLTPCLDADVLNEWLHVCWTFSTLLVSDCIHLWYVTSVMSQQFLFVIFHTMNCAQQCNTDCHMSLSDCVIDYTRYIWCCFCMI